MSVLAFCKAGQQTILGWHLQLKDFTADDPIL